MKRVAKIKRGDTMATANLLIQTPLKMPSFCGCLPQSWVSHLWGLFLELSMAKRKTINSGSVFGRLKVIGPIAVSSGESKSLCVCECGKEVAARNEKLLGGRKKSCGCLQGTRHIHGMSSHPCYPTWEQMRQRCSNPNAVNYDIYGSKGICVCDRWEDFTLFMEDMGPRPDGYTIERNDSNGHYEPSNCRWATRTEQNNNTSRNRHVTIGDRTMTVSQWARETGLHKSTITARLNRGVSGVDLLCVQ